MKKKLLLIVAIICVTMLVTVVVSIIWYKLEIKSPDGNEAADITIEIESGTSTSNILKLLKEKNIIKNEFAAKIYVHINKINSLKAGKYKFSGKESLREVLDKISNGEIVVQTINITFKEGKNIRAVADEIVKNTNNSIDDVFSLLEDEEYINSLIEKYWFLTDEIKSEGIYYPLEGYLYPDTYNFKDENVDVKTIFETMLNQTGIILSKYKERMENANISVHQVLTVGSIIELEGNNSENREKIARVIYNRLNKNMSIGSDVTTYYAARVDIGSRDLYLSEINTYNPYNTRGPDMSGKMPIGPISNVSEQSIKAALYPAKGNYLYFVADKNGKIYFSNTNEEHDKTINSLKKEGLWYEY